MEWIIKPNDSGQSINCGSDLLEKKLVSFLAGHFFFLHALILLPLEENIYKIKNAMNKPQINR